MLDLSNITSKDGSYYYSSTVKKAKTGNTMLDEMLERLKEKQACQIQTLTAQERKKMSMNEYKQYFQERLDEITKNSHLHGTEIIFDISDEAWQELKDNPLYEMKILNTIAKDLYSTLPKGKMEALIFHIGETLEDYFSEEKYEKSLANEAEQVKENFWEQRTKRFKESMKEAEKISRKRNLKNELLQEDLIFELQQRAELEKFINSEDMPWIANERHRYIRGVSAKHLLGML